MALLPAYQSVAKTSGVFTLQTAMQALVAGQWCTDPSFDQTTLLLQADGVANDSDNSTFIDSSSTSPTLTTNGNVRQNQFTPFSQPNGYWGGYFDGTTDYITAASNAAFALPGDFTVELWIYPTQISGSERGIFGIGTTDPNSNLIRIQQSSSKLQFWLGGSNSGGPGSGTKTGIITCTTVLSLNTWYHIAWVRSGTGSNNVKLYLNGVLDGQGTGTYDITANPCGVGTGYPGTSIETFFGYISNVRVVKGAALYTANFNPPTTPLTTTVSSGTVSFLTCQSNAIKDTSSNSFTITVNGNVSTQLFSPFAPVYSAAEPTTGGSAVFPGSSYVSGTSSICTATDFTIEFFGYFPASAPSSFVFVGVSTGPLITFDASFFPLYGRQGGYILTGNIVVPVGQWVHLAYVRSGTTVSAYVNARFAGSATDANNYSASQSWGFGGGTGASPLPNGVSISNFRSVGSALYSGTSTTTNNFTIPTAPFTSSTTNTLLLMSATNAGIIDVSLKNNIQTIGNTKVSTSIYKYGTGSIAFDGTGDWITLPNGMQNQMQGGDFTAEGWVYITTLGSARGLISKGTASTGWAIGVTSGNVLQASYTSTTLSGTTLLVANTWYHFAMVRSGTATGNIKIYLNGVLEATSATAITTDFNQTESMYVGADRVGGSPMIGYMDDVRLTKGVARYTAAFTPPQVAFPRQ